MRQTVIALRMADLVGASDADREATYYLGLLMNAYCHADAAEQARWFGDDISLKGDGFEMLDMSTVADRSRSCCDESARTAAVLQRAKRVAAFPVAGHEGDGRLPDDALDAGRAVRRADRAGDAVSRRDPPGLRAVGRQGPAPAAARRADQPARTAGAAGQPQSRSSAAGAASTPRVAVARAQPGTQFDPALVDLFCAHAPELLDGLDRGRQLGRRSSTPSRGLPRRVGGADLDEVLEAMADLVDLKSPFLAGHSRGVANLAAEAARVSGSADDDVVHCGARRSSTTSAGSASPTRSGTRRARSPRLNTSASAYTPT